MRKTAIQRLSASMLTGVAMLALAPSASAQYWGRGGSPDSGACFYEDVNFGGRYFCTRVGDGNPRVPSNVNDEISSIRLFGNAEVVLFRDGNMRGEARRFANGVRDLRSSGFNDRMSSYVVQPRGYNGNWGDANGVGSGGGYNGGGYNGGGYNGGGYNNGGYSGGASRGGYGGYDGANGGSANSGRSRNGASRWTYEQAESMVRQSYRRVLGRDPDPAAQPWVNQVMDNNWSQRQLEDALRNSPEGRRR